MISWNQVRQGVPFGSLLHPQGGHPRHPAGPYVPRHIACYHRLVTEQGKSGKRVVTILLATVFGVSLIAWFAASRLERDANARQRAAGEVETAAVINDGVMFEATEGDPGYVIAKDVGSGKELWRAELGSVTTKPGVKVVGERVEVEIAGTPWMTLDRTTGEAVD